MSSAQQPTPGTDLARAESEIRAVGDLPPEIQRALSLRKAQNIVAARIAGMSWGENIDETTRRAIGDWSQQFRVDPSTEIFVLGNRIYLSAAFYLRRLGEMIAAGLVEYAYADHVEPDARLAQLGAEGEGEASRRLRERITFRIPDEVKSAVVFHVKLRILERDMVGAKWCGTGEKTASGKFVDPIGEAKPVETSETRAARRVLRLITSHVPSEFSVATRAVEAAAEALSERIGEGAARVKRSELAGADLRQLGQGPIAEGEFTRAADSERMPVLRPDQIARAAGSPDPYVTPGTEHIATPFDDDPFPPKPAAGPVTETLFGTSEPMEPTADEKAAADAAEQERILEEDRRLLAEEDRRRAS